ncbi:hypothetical protein KDA23_07845, partial [Candidatus Saccharibacteria bacterium]|nr:hypothetical protein [Candidatus Saccharibacteria bacterium]
PEMYGMARWWSKERVVNNIYRKKQIVGCAIHRREPLPQEWRYLWADCLATRAERGELSIIDIKRMNLLERYVSQVIAEKTKSWIDTVDKGVHVHEGTLVLDPLAVERDFKAQQMSWRHKEHIFRDAKNVLHITYEQLRDAFDSTMGVVQEFIGLEVTTLAQKTVKRERRHMRSVIENYDEVIAHLIGDYPEHLGLD